MKTTMLRIISLLTLLFAFGIIGVNLSAHARKNQDHWNNKRWKSNQAEFSSAQNRHSVQRRNFLDRLKDIKVQSESRKKRQNPPTSVTTTAQTTAGTTTAQTTAGTTTAQTTAGTTTAQTTAETTAAQTTAGTTIEPTNAEDNTAQTTAGTTIEPTNAEDNTAQTTAGTTIEPTNAEDNTAQTTAGTTIEPTNADDNTAQTTQGSPTTPTTASTKPTNPTDNVLAFACRKPVPPGEDHSSLKCYQCSSNTSNDPEPICDTRLWKYLKHSEKTRARSSCHPKLGKFCVKTVKQKYGERITKRGCFGSTMQGPNDTPIATRTGCVSYTRNGYLTTACFCNHNYCNKAGLVGSSLFIQILFEIMIVFQVYVQFS